MIRIVCFLVVVTVTSANIFCRPEYCDKPCEKVHCGPDERFAEKGGICNCCDACIKQLKVGADCFAQKPQFLTEECGNGTHCVDEVISGFLGTCQYAS